MPENKHFELEDIRTKVLERAVQYAGQDGWRDDGLIRATRELELDDKEMHLAFPDGLASLLSYFCLSGDRQAEQILKEAGLSEMRIQDRIRHGVRVRLEVDQYRKPVIRALLKAFASPPMSKTGVRALYDTADCLWRAAGDTARDYNHYTKRLILSGVYSSTVLIWLSDGTEDHAKTWAFLDKRIEGVMRFEQTKMRVLNLFSDLKSRRGTR